MEVELPDGTVAEFPDDIDPAVMKKAIRQHLMTAAVDGGVEGAMAGAQARTAPRPSDMLPTIKPEMGYFDTMGELDRARENMQTANVDQSFAGAMTGLSTLPVAMAPARIGGAVMGGQEGYRKGGPLGAVIGAGVGAVAPGATNIASLSSLGAQMAGGGTAASAIAAVAGLALRRYGLGGAAAKFAKMFGGDVNAAKTALETAAKAAPAPEKLRLARLTVKEAEAALAPMEAALIETGHTAQQAAGVAAKAPQNAVMEFAKKAASRNGKLGEKIHIELSSNGEPLRVLTPDQAGAAARAGKKTTWVKDIWTAKEAM